ncbi:hypothetical protein [Spirochaeta isovalerica]|uniref:Uncharacterized protein n=1 Tax=Spirochaeta isovalerica TaxID=150 RepID=A0A841R7K4_9SPIO|nr:hypothetical protein [Spirochaeta isovalerica]MBB6478472.1 hypothetical protein [Spirochaeta isovalerica]
MLFEFSLRIVHDLVKLAIGPAKIKEIDLRFAGEIGGLQGVDGYAGDGQAAIDLAVYKARFDCVDLTVSA